MKRILAAGSVAALATVVFAGTASADTPDAACFGQIHKLVNSGGIGLDNVGQLVQASDGYGLGKNATAATFCP